MFNLMLIASPASSNTLNRTIRYTDQNVVLVLPALTLSGGKTYYSKQERGWSFDGWSVWLNETKLSWKFRPVPSISGEAMQLALQAAFKAQKKMENEANIWTAFGIQPIDECYNPQRNVEGRGTFWKRYPDWHCEILNYL